ncbi:uncharacterized protein LOC120536812 isoform X3 [Polypterus senegalus]|nr:uncharacterized protein LOC120536812 isoform X3 [Polypterus senegalus]
MEVAQAVRCYVDDTFNYITLIERYINNFPEWSNLKEMELYEIQDILDGVRSLNRTLTDAMQAKSVKTFMKYKLTPRLKSSTEKELRKKLKKVLGSIFESMPVVREIPEAIEKLSVTLPAVFCNTNKLLKYPEGMNEKKVQLFIAMAKEVAPYLVNFLRDVKDLFKDDLENVENLAYQHALYVQAHRELHRRIASRCAKLNDHHFFFFLCICFLCICMYVVFKAMHSQKHFAVSHSVKDLQLYSVGSKSKDSFPWGFLVIPLFMLILYQLFLKK